jgi:hypothetical protein
VCKLEHAAVRLPSLSSKITSLPATGTTKRCFGWDSSVSSGRRWVAGWLLADMHISPAGPSPQTGTEFLTKAGDLEIKA